MKQGFSLTELLVVIAIIGMLALIAIPSVISIRERIDTRLFESKKNIILMAAELYGQDNEDIFDENDEASVTVGFLIEFKYVKKDMDADGDICTDSYGCAVDPRDQTNMNNIEILIRRNISGTVAIWQGTASSSSSVLVSKVKTDLNCTPTSSNPCLYTGEVKNNYLSYSGVMWRILGVYLIDGTEVVKLITEDNITTD